MADRPASGRLKHRVAFDRRGTGSDGHGGTSTAFAEQFTCRAAYIHLRGGETVQAARLEGRHPQIIRVRASSSSDQVSTDWRIRDRDTGAVFAIRDIERRDDGMYIDFLAESGVAA